jgi:glycosyltransferase involved in cell wall biosynthesis
MRVAIVMPPATELPPDVALDLWPTVVQQATALRDHAHVDVMVACRTLAPCAAATERDGIPYRFAPTDRGLTNEVLDWKPDVVHVHGLGFTRLTFRLGRALRGRAAVVLQHHGEPPGDRLHLLAHRVVRRYVDGYLFTGAQTGQAQPFVDRGQIDANAPLFDVLEAASTLPANSPPVELAGKPVVLWVGRLIESKDPLAAVAAFATVAADALPVATDRTLEPAVRDALVALGPLGERVHVHDPVAPASMRGWYAAADVFVSTSWREGSGYALIEAITEGCAPVATSIPSHLAIVGDLAPAFAPGDVTAAAGLIVAAAAMDRSAIRSAAASRLSWPAVAEQLVDAYARVLGQPRRSR